MGEHAYRTEGEELGKEIVRFRWRGMPAATAIFGIVFIGMPVGVCLAALTGAIPMGDNWNVGSYFGALLFVLMPIFGVWFLIDLRRRRNDCAIVHEEGVVLLRKGAEKHARFRDVVALRSSVRQEVRNGIAGPVMHTHTLRLEDRTSLMFTHGFEDIEGLAATLRRKTGELMLPRAREALSEGRSVSFGPITMTREGLTWRNTTATWKELGLVDVADGTLTARRNGIRWLSVNAADVDNLHVLVQLAAERDFPKQTEAAATA